MCALCLGRSEAALAVEQTPEEQAVSSARLLLRLGGDVHDWLRGGREHRWSVTMSGRERGGERKAKRGTVVSSHKGVAVGAPLLPVDPLLCLLEGDVHVAVDGL